MVCTTTQMNILIEGGIVYILKSRMLAANRHICSTHTSTQISNILNTIHQNHKIEFVTEFEGMAQPQGKLNFQII